jgi:hypothetical protein
LASRTVVFVSVYILSVHEKFADGAKFAAVVKDLAICLKFPDSEVAVVAAIRDP